MKIKNILKWGQEELFLSSSSARLDAELLLSHILQKPAAFLLAHDEKEVGWFALWRYKRLIAKRREGIPVAYLTGHKEFYFLDFQVNPHVLVPRPDTEVLAGAVIDYIDELKNPILLDVGTGSGCIAISVIKNAEGLKAIATDVSRAALRVARRNARHHRVISRIEFIRSDLLAKVPLERLKKHDVVLTANLPYIPTDFEVNPETKFEPHLSLYGGGDGMDIYKRLMKQVREFRPRAIFLELFEFQIATLAKDLPGYELRRTEKMTGQARMLYLSRI